jgi:predicted nucleotidyltransferase
LRITEEEKVKIKSIVQRWCPKAQVYLFGSRTHDNALGGDIDLLILADNKISFNEKLDIIVDLNIEVGEQKYDVLSYGFDDTDAFKKHILNSAILL